ncbi:unnamed protein product [Macrosiphum euphorbiae]|uniref:Uncharacterized protein n=1 Tax=Macrosiphum euphorbiae TaxID=13131 RepID=A0AAV0VX28_9HEMI|nr:unnamed protein product [Macrosiphum euphorbiae]
MEANVGSSRCTQSSDYADEGRCLIDALDLAGDRNNTTVGCPLRCGLAESFRSTPELTNDSPVDNPVVKIDSPPVPSVITTAVADDLTETLKCLQQHYGLSMIDALDLAVDRRITTTVGLQLRPLRENVVIFQSSAELIIHSAVYRPVTSVPPVVPVLTTAEADNLTETPKRLQQHYGLSMIDALDLAVDRRITTTVGLQLRPLRENSVIFRSSAELRIHSPVYGPVKSVPPVAAEIQPNPARSGRRRSLWKRSKRFMWKSMVNFARRICFCQSFVDLE